MLTEALQGCPAVLAAQDPTVPSHQPMSRETAISLKPVSPLHEHVLKVMCPAQRLKDRRLSTKTNTSSSSGELASRGEGLSPVVTGLMHNRGGSSSEFTTQTSKVSVRMLDSTSQNCGEVSVPQGEVGMSSGKGELPVP